VSSCTGPRYRAITGSPLSEDREESLRACALKRGWSCMSKRQAAVTATRPEDRKAESFRTPMKLFAIIHRARPQWKWLQPSRKRRFGRVNFGLRQTRREEAILRGALKCGTLTLWCGRGKSFNTSIPTWQKFRQEDSQLKLISNGARNSGAPNIDRILTETHMQPYP